MAQGPGFATEGSLEKEFIVHIYRFTASPNDEGALVQLHPATTTIDVTVKDPPLSDHLQVCPVAPGYREHPRTGPCSELGTVAITGGGGHKAFLITASDKTVAIKEIQVRYRAADNFLAVEFSGCCH